MLRFKLNVRIQQTSTEINLPVGEFGFGREPTNDLQIPDPRVSRRHAKFITTAEDCQIVDLGSANGTFVDGEALQANVPVVLADRAEIKAGDAVLQLIFETVKEAPGAPPEDSTRQRPKPVEPPQGQAEEPAPKLVVEEAKPVTARPVAAAPPKAEPVAAKAEPPAKKKEAKPPEPPAPPKPPSELASQLPPGQIPGLEAHSLRLINYLPDIYRTDFLSRFLALFESIELPIEWIIDHFDLFLDVDSAPVNFLPWLAGWFGVPFDNTWSEEKRRLYLREAHLIYSRRGTRWALSRMLEIYTGAKPEILEFVAGKEPLYFKVRLPMKAAQVDREVLMRLIDDHKPAHTVYEVEFAQ